MSAASLPIDAVEVRARVSGYLDKIHFQDGQIVKQGDLLFTIDRRPFQNTLDQARASLAQAKATLAFAEGDYGRAEKLVRDKTITEQTFDQRQQAKRNAEASVTWNEMAVRQASLDLEFTELRAPVTGRIGDRRVSPGNLVTGGSGGGTTLLATIVSTDPIRFEFSFDEASFLRYTRLAQGSTDETSRGISAPVAAEADRRAGLHPPGQDGFRRQRHRPTSGTIRGRAQFANPDGVLTPGMFGRIQVAGSAPYEALLVPDVCDRHRAGAQVRARGRRRQCGRSTKYVTLGQVIDGLRVIKSGLAPDDSVIVNGLMRARPGQKVTPQQEKRRRRLTPQAERELTLRCGYRTSSSIGRFSPPSSRSCS